MKINRLRITVLVAIVFVLVSIVFSFIGLTTANRNPSEVGGLGKLFAASPNIDIVKGDVIISLGDYTVNFNLGFDKPFLSLLSNGFDIHVNVIILLFILGAMVISCAIPEISAATSCIVASMVGVAIVRLVPVLNDAVAAGASPWDVGASSFWLISFLLSVLIINGMIGIGGKFVNAIILSRTAVIIVTMLIAILLANAVSLILSLLAYVTIGLGWCGGVVLWLVVAILIVAFCEVMDIISF